MSATENELRNLLGVLRRRRWTILVCVALCGAAALAVSLAQTKQYTASATLLFRDPGFDQKLFGSSFLPPSTDAEREAETNVELVSLDSVAARAARSAGGGITPAEAAQKIKALPGGHSNVVNVLVTDANPVLAARLANAAASQY